MGLAKAAGKRPERGGSVFKCSLVVPPFTTNVSSGPGDTSRFVSKFSAKGARIHRVVDGVA